MDLDGRCDLSSYRKRTHNIHGERSEMSVLSNILNKNDLDLFIKELDEAGISLISIIHVLWHKVLNIFGSSSKTVLHVLEINGNESFLQSINHDKLDKLSFLDAVRCFEMHDVVDDNAADCVFRCESFKEDYSTNQYPLQFFFEHENLRLGIAFDGLIFSESSLSSFLEVAIHLGEQVIANPHLLIEHFSTVPVAQLERMESWNCTDGVFPEHMRLEQLFEQEVARSGNKAAISCAGKTVSYHKLNCGANQVARCLRETFNVFPGQLIGLLMDKSVCTITFLLGLWKCGAAAVAIDPAYPDKRVRFSVSDTSLSFVLTGSEYEGRMNKICNGMDIKIISVEQILGLSREMSNMNYNLELSNKELAYISYTSGTTGTPKGIKKKHFSLVNSITDLSLRYKVKDSSVENIVLYSSYVFEPFYRQMLMALVNGHNLHIVDDALKMDSVRFSRFLETEKVTYLNGTPSILQEYDYSKCPCLKRLVLVGEQLTTVRYNNLRSKFKGNIICEYGFTESAFVSLLKQLDENDTRTDTSLGKPVRNVKCYILDKELKLVPEGVTGVLYVGGAGVSSGYLNRESLTRERFIPNHFKTDDDQKKGINSTLYNTGDLTSWRKDGEVRFHGRSDFQIKLRGIRIEPGEIETVLSSCPGIKECVVVVRSASKQEDEAGRVLVAFYTTKQANKVEEKYLKKCLEESLARYMIPSRIVEVNRIPVNINGKIDMGALPEIPIHARSMTNQSSSQIEQILTDIWSKVLGIKADYISPDDDFFMLGGNSIRCVQAISLIQQHLDCPCSVEDFFNLKKLNLIAQKLVGREKIEGDKVGFKTNEQMAIQGIVHRRKKFLANSMQQSMAYQSLKGDKSQGVYTMQSIHEVTANIEPNIFKQSWLLTQQKFSALRSSFQLEGKVYQMSIQDYSPLIFSYHDFVSSLDYENQIQDMLILDRKKMYNISEGPLFRVYLISIPGGKSLVLFSCHHIILDGWSLPILFNFVFKAYTKLSQGQNAVYLIDNSYEDAQAYLESKNSKYNEEDNAFWTAEIEKVQDRSNLLGLLLPNKRKIQLSAYNQVEIQEELEICIKSFAELHSFSRKHGLTLNSVLQFAWHQVLAAYGNAKQTVVGTTISGRHIPIIGIDNSVGMMINTLPVVFDHSSSGFESVVSAIGKIQSKINQINERSHCWLAKLPTENFKHELFDSLFVFDVYPTNTITYEEGSFTVRKVNNYDKLDFPLVVVANGNESCVSFKLMFEGEIFDPECIKQMLNLVDYLVTQIVTIEDLTVGKLDLVIPAQKDIIREFNQTDKCYPLHLSLHQIFEKEAARVADKTAVIYKDRSLTYKVLNNLANVLAEQLRSTWGVLAGDRVALFQHKSELLVVSILALWKCGAAFVPIGVDYPADRVDFILQDSGSKLVITCSEGEKNFESLNIIYSKYLLNVQGANLSEEQDIPNLDLDLRPSDLAYIIYTSGTTGKPKGVMVPHKGVVNLKFALEELFQLKHGNEVILSFSNYIFDHFVEQMSDGILTGQTLLILDDALRYDKDGLHEYMAKNKVTYLSGTPTVVSQYNISNLPHLTRVDVVGEDLKEETFNKLRAQFSGLIINGYGPTEISITSHKRLYHTEDKRSNKSIGHQVSNTKTYVVNHRQQLLPVGAVGEMLIGGVGVTEGYLNNTELTQQKFVSNNFDGQDDRIYASGDLVKWLPNGEVEYFGRADQQVKIRGIRVEVAEIESVIGNHPSVNQAAVKVTDSSKLVAFVSLKSEDNISEHDIKNYISSKIPLSLVPHRIVIMEELPVSSSGKLNYKMLPEIEHIAENIASPFTPINEVEEKLASLWLSVLSIPASSLSADLNFFQAGGDSLSIVHLISAIRDTFKVSLTVNNIMNHSTISKQSSFILDRKTRSVPSIYPGNTSLRASHEQEKLLFIEERESGTNAYNIHMIYNLRSNIDIITLEKAIYLLLQQRTILRTVYAFEKDGFYQNILSMDNLGTVFSTHDGALNDLEEILVFESKHVFSLKSAPPIRVLAIRCSDRVVLSVVIHHVAFDGHSMALFEKNIENLYTMLSRDEVVNDENIVQFSDFCRYAKDRERDDSIFKDAENKIWPTKINPDFACDDTCNEGRKITLHFDEVWVSRLDSLANSEKVTMNCLLTAAFFQTLRRVTGQNNVSCASPFGTRTIEYFNTIGYFVTMKQLLLDMDKTENFPDQLQNIKNQIFCSLKDAHKNNNSNKSISIVFATHKDMPDLNPGYLLESRFELGAKEFSPAKFDIYFEVITGNCLKVNVTYKHNLYKPDTINDLVYEYFGVLKSLSSHLKPLPVLPVPSQDDPSYTSNIGSVFRNIALQFNDKVALIQGENRMTYNDVLCKSIQIALVLQSKFSIKEGDCVGLYLKKDMNMVISILGVWMLGAAYVPIDPEQAPARVRFMFSETNAKVILSNRGISERLDSLVNCPVLTVDGNEATRWNEIEQKKQHNFRPYGTVDNIAYIMYTSGTTGNPKGVQVTQNNVIKFLLAIKDTYFHQHHLDFSRVFYLSNYSFDFSIEQIMLSIFRGGCLVLPVDNGPVVFDDDFYKYISTSGVDFISGTPSHLALCNLSRVIKLQVLLLAGEGVTKQHFKTFRASYSGVIIQAYGTTETTVYNTYKIYRGDETFTSSIGRTLPNTLSFVMDEDMQEVKEGQLCLMGECVSNGYLNRPKENAQSFVEFSPRMLYKTGDRVRVLDNGELQFIGRNDSQLSVNGLRIEKGEVETHILNYGKIKQTHVMLRPATNTLVCFLVSNEEVDVKKLEEYLQQMLPISMVPKIILPISSFPLTNNGKIDGQQLLQHCEQAELKTNEPVETSVALTDFELRICTIWKAVLGTKHIGLDDDFFFSGGDSIKSLHLVAEIRRNLSTKITVKEIFIHRTIRKQSLLIVKRGKSANALNDVIKSTKQTCGQTIPMLPIQKWFFTKDLQSKDSWNQCFTMKVPSLDAEKLKNAVENVICAHEQFRCRFRESNDGWIQYKGSDCNERANFHLIECADMSRNAILKKLATIQEQFNLGKGPLHAVVCIRERERTLLWFSVHHLLIDTFSWEIIREDLRAICEGRIGSVKRSIMFGDWANKLFCYDWSTEIRLYWIELRENIAGWVTDVSHLLKTEDVHRFIFIVDAESTSKLFQSKSFSPYILLLTSLGKTLKAMTGLVSNFVTLEGHGRESEDEDLASTVGWFTSMYPAELAASDNLLESIELIENMRASVPQNGVSYGPLHGYTDGMLPPITFNFLGFMSGSSSHDWAIVDEFGLSEFPLETARNSDTLIDITAAVYEGILKVEVWSRVSKEFTSLLIDTFEANIKEISCLEIAELSPNIMPHSSSDYSISSTSSSFNTSSDEEKDNDPYEVFISFERERLFVLPPGEGGAESYLNNIAPLLQPHYSLYLFNNLYKDKGKPSTITQLAELFSTYITNIQRSGRVNLLGWSFGGVLAFEIAIQLARRGVSVGNVFLIDPFFDVPSAYRECEIPYTTVVVDEINMGYQPAKAEVHELFEKSKSCFVLFKMTKAVSDPETELDRKFFRYYLDELFNNLDNLIPVNWINKHEIADNHYSWVKNQQEVLNICSQICKYMDIDGEKLEHN